MHIHMKPADLQHTQAAQPTRRATKSSRSDADAISETQNRNNNTRRDGQNQKNGGGRPPNDGRKSLAAALTAFDVFGPETVHPTQDETPAPEIADLLALMTR